MLEVTVIQTVKGKVQCLVLEVMKRDFHLFSPMLHVRQPRPKMAA
jgi:hypothetical protein